MLAVRSIAPLSAKSSQSLPVSASSAISRASEVGSRMRLLQTEAPAAEAGSS
jgi:hypothetical protein